jgi:hypothetical protein
VTIADNTGPLDSFIGTPSINEDGVVAFWADHDNPGEGIYAGDGGELVTIAKTSMNDLHDIDRHASINASGAVAFRAGFDNAYPADVGILVGNGDRLTTIVDDERSWVFFGEAPRINDMGTVVFLGAYIGPDASGSGIYTGPDPVLDKVVEVGDPLFGSTAVRVNLGDINELGDIAFSYELESGVKGVAIAVYPDAACAADCDGDGELDILDFICFQGLFLDGDIEADCDANAKLDILDFVCFQAAFQKGCP